MRGRRENKAPDYVRPCCWPQLRGRAKSLNAFEPSTRIFQTLPSGFYHNLLRVPICDALVDVAIRIMNILVEFAIS